MDKSEAIEILEKCAENARKYMPLVAKTHENLISAKSIEKVRQLLVTANKLWDKSYRDMDGNTYHNIVVAYNTLFGHSADEYDAMLRDKDAESLSSVVDWRSQVTDVTFMVEYVCKQRDVEPTSEGILQQSPEMQRQLLADWRETASEELDYMKRNADDMARIPSDVKAILERAGATKAGEDFAMMSLSLKADSGVVIPPSIAKRIDAIIDKLSTWLILFEQFHDVRTPSSLSRAVYSPEERKYSVAGILLGGARDYGLKLFYAYFATIDRDFSESATNETPPNINELYKSLTTIRLLGKAGGDWLTRREIDSLYQSILDISSILREYKEEYML